MASTSFEFVEHSDRLYWDPAKKYNYSYLDLWPGTSLKMLAISPYSPRLRTKLMNSRPKSCLWVLEIAILFTLFSKSKRFVISKFSFWVLYNYVCQLRESSKFCSSLWRSQVHYFPEAFCLFNIFFPPISIFLFPVICLYTYLINLCIT